MPQVVATLRASSGPATVPPADHTGTKEHREPRAAVEDGVGVEYYAEKDMYVVISNCPYADQALPFPEAKPNPVYITVYDTGIEPETGHLGLPPSSEWQKIVYDRIATKDTSPK